MTNIVIYRLSERSLLMSSLFLLFVVYGGKRSFGIESNFGVQGRG